MTTSDETAQVLMKAAANASVIADQCDTITDRIDPRNPLAAIMAIGEVSVGLGMIAEAVRDACEALAVERAAERIVNLQLETP